MNDSGKSLKLMFSHDFVARHKFFPGAVDASNRHPPVLVTGIQRRRVRDGEESFHTKDFARLDSCDNPRV
ncbi:integrase [Rhizobiaceae bacterium LC148]|nr:integrase [Rhizobiaceae bacterium LC148]